jgi:DNA repair ATPase RecN
VNIALGDIKGNLENNLIEVVTELNAVTEMQKTLEKDKETIEKMENISPATKALVRRIHPDTKTLLNLRRKTKED